jgi:UDP:flavonoid glycosyltransferase YjiC (YdhE family)
MTVGHKLDRGTLPLAPPNVHVEPWVPQSDVLPHAAAAVTHGGAGSTLGALAAARPLVLVPLFADQPHNAQRVEAVGAGLAVAPEPAAMRDAIVRVLTEPSFGQRAADVAGELRAQRPVGEAVELLEQLARG